MMNKYPLVALLFLLGCASADQSMHNNPDLVFGSAKGAESVASCIAEQWKTYSAPGGESVPVTLRKTLGSYQLTASCGGGKICKVAEVTTTFDKQSKTEMYTIAIGEGRYLDAVRYCQ